MKVLHYKKAKNYVKALHQFQDRIYSFKNYTVKYCFQLKTKIQLVVQNRAWSL